VINRAKFNDCFQNGQIYWRCFDPAAAVSTNNHSSPLISAKQLPSQPSGRHSHSSVIVNDKLYVFGGLSATNTSYNDLWLLDLNTKEWSRPACSGTYPSPKAAASLLEYGDGQLILYGGYSHPYSYPFNQQVNFFDEMHFYCTRRHVWSQMLIATQDSPKLAGHSASILNKTQMILFGGCNGNLG
jgi:N-acetylneuraminic acid mutarotase